MASSQDTEITLGTGKLLVLFFGLIAICALFFGLGYALGRKSEPALATNLPAQPQAVSSASKPAGTGSQPAPPMTFFKAVEQPSGSPQPTPTKTDTPAETPAVSPASQPATTTPPQSAAPATPDGITLPTSSSYYVQVAAVTKQEDAEALVEALKKKQYPAFVAPAPGNDKLFRVQLGPFSDIKDAEAMRARLIGDGYNPIVKK
jgi:cell division septation protein DedD